MNNLFTELENQNKQIPLAEILRPKTLEDFLGQSNVVSPNSPILNLLKTYNPVIALFLMLYLICQRYKFESESQLYRMIEPHM